MNQKKKPKKGNNDLSGIVKLVFGIFGFFKKIFGRKV